MERSTGVQGEKEKTKSEKIEKFQIEKREERQNVFIYQTYPG